MTSPDAPDDDTPQSVDMDQLLVDHIPLLRKAIRAIPDSAMPPGWARADVLQAAFEWALRQARRYDSARGANPNTWVRHLCQWAPVTVTQRAQPISAYSIERSRAVADARVHLARTGRDGSDDESVGRLLGLDGAEHVRRVVDEGRLPDLVSLEEPFGPNVGHSDFTVGDTLADAGSSSRVVEVVEAQRTIAEIVGRIATLPERDQTVLLRYYGLDGMPEAILADIGDQLGLTRERVRQVRNRARDEVFGGEPSLARVAG